MQSALKKRVASNTSWHLYFSIRLSSLPLLPTSNHENQKKGSLSLSFLAICQHRAHGNMQNCGYIEKCLLNEGRKEDHVVQPPAAQVLCALPNSPRPEYFLSMTTLCFIFVLLMCTFLIYLSPPLHHPTVQPTRLEKPQETLLSPGALPDGLNPKSPHLPLTFHRTESASLNKPDLYYFVTVQYHR